MSGGTAGGSAAVTYGQRQAMRRQLLPDIEFNVLLSDPLQAFQTERFVRAGVGNRQQPAGGSGGEGGEVPPPYFMHGTDEWRRVRAVVPLMDGLAKRFGPQLHAGIRHSGQQMLDVVVPHRAGVLVVPFSLLLVDGFRRHWSTRLQEAQPPTGSANGLGHAFVVCCMVLVDSEEPQMDVLSWINLLCMELRVALQLVWSWDEGCAVVEGFAEAHAEGGFGGPQQDRVASLGPIPILVQALSQTPALMTRQDVVRAGNRVETVADLLLIQEDALLALPGIGPKKAKRIVGVMGAPFPTTEGRLHDVWVPSDPPPPPLPPGTAPRQGTATERTAAAATPVGGIAASSTAGSVSVAVDRGTGGGGTQLQGRAGGGPRQPPPPRSNAFNAALQELLAREDAADDDESAS